MDLVWAVVLLSIVAYLLLLLVLPICVLVAVSASDTKAEKPNTFARVLSSVLVVLLVWSSTAPIAFEALSGLGCESSNVCDKSPMLWGLVALPILVAPLYWRMMDKARVNKLVRPSLAKFSKVVAIAVVLLIAGFTFNEFRGNQLLESLNMNPEYSDLGGVSTSTLLMFGPLLIVSLVNKALPRETAYIVIGWFACSALLMANWIIVEKPLRTYPDLSDPVVGAVVRATEGGEPQYISRIQNSDYEYSINIIDPEGHIKNALLDQQFAVKVEGRYLTPSEASEYDDRRTKVMLIEKAQPSTLQN